MPTEEFFCMSEASHEHRDRFRPQPAFFESAQRLARHERLGVYPIVQEDDKRIVRRLFRGDDSYSQIPGVVFSFDFDEKKSKQPETHSGRFIFEYSIPSQTKAKQKNIAQMHFEEHPHNEFRLFHRYVAPGARKNGLGTRLFQLAEEWFLYFSQETQSPVTFGLQASQKSVFEWAEKMGFVVREDDRERYDEIREHPERFFEDEVIVSEESQREGVVKDKYIFRIGTQGRYMEDAVRLTFTKRIDFAAKDFSVGVEVPSE